MASRFTEEIDGEGVAWAAAGFVASLLIGVVVEPFRDTVGLENVALGYLLVVVVTAAVGGRAAGLISALSAALSYDFFLTTPYHSLTDRLSRPGDHGRAVVRHRPRRKPRRESPPATDRRSRHPSRHHPPPQHDHPRGGRR